jgi:hypothetical protein
VIERSAAGGRAATEPRIVDDPNGDLPAQSELNVIFGIFGYWYSIDAARDKPPRRPAATDSSNRTSRRTKVHHASPKAPPSCDQLIANGQQPPLMLYLVWSEYTRLAKQVAAAALFGILDNRSAKLVALPEDLISRFETGLDPTDLSDV